MPHRRQFFVSRIWLLWSVVVFAGLTALPGRAQGGTAPSPSSALADRAREVLDAAVRTATGWIWIHAIET